MSPKAAALLQTPSGTYQNRTRPLDLTVSGVTGASISSVSGSGTTWTVTANTGSGSGLLTLRMINATGIMATVTTPLPFAGGMYQIDRSLPRPTLSSTAPNPTNISLILVTVTFSEPVTGFDFTDLVISNGTAQNFTGSGRSYTFDLIPIGDGLVTVNIPANAAQDPTGNLSTAATQFSRTYAAAMTTLELPVYGMSPPFDVTAVIVPGQISLSPTNAPPMVNDLAAAQMNAGLCAEGAVLCGSFMLMLDAQPSADVTITITVSDANEIALADTRLSVIPMSALSFVFSPTAVTADPNGNLGAWDRAVIVSISALNDGLVEGMEDFYIRVTTTSADPNFNGVVSIPFRVTVYDTDVINIIPIDPVLDPQGDTGTNPVIEPPIEVPIEAPTLDPEGDDIEPTPELPTDVPAEAPTVGS